VAEVQPETLLLYYLSKNKKRCQEDFSQMKIKPIMKKRVTHSL